MIARRGTERATSMEASLLDLEERQLHRRRFAWTLTIFILFVLMVTGAGWAIFWSPVLRVKEASVSGNSELRQSEVLSFLRGKILERSSWYAFLGFDNLLVWQGDFRDDELRSMPMVETASISRSFRDGMVTINIVERKPFGVWCFMGTRINADVGETRMNADGVRGNQRIDPRESASKCFWFAKNGIILGPAPLVEGNIIPRVSDYVRPKADLGEKVLPPQFLPNLMLILETLDASGLSIKEVRLDSLEDQEIKVLTYDGPSLYFSLRFPAATSLAVIRSFLTKPDDFRRLEYLDFRVENRAYYK